MSEVLTMNTSHFIAVCMLLPMVVISAVLLWFAGYNITAVNGSIKRFMLQQLSKKHFRTKKHLPFYHFLIFSSFRSPDKSDFVTFCSSWIHRSIVLSGRKHPVLYWCKRTAATAHVPLDILTSTREFTYYSDPPKVDAVSQLTCKSASS